MSDKLNQQEKESFLNDQTAFEQKGMVGWYNARQLLGTAIKTVVSSLFGAYADKREIQACLSEPVKYDFNYSNRDEIWIDYVADTGDGFHPTFTMAHLLSEKDQSVEGHHTSKGDILILGGDQVYPVATREDYTNRFRGPFEAACRNQPNQDASKDYHLYAVPGNHDWYDGLSNFIKIFCQNRTIGNWQTKQHRSYFAIKLPNNWWLWGIDIQLEADIDYPQLQYFEKIADTEMKKGDNIILCTAEPSWVFTTQKNDQTYDNLKFFEQRYIIEKGFNLVLTLAGDLHHYSHYSLTENGNEYHKITSGGGGAFLHPTHNLKEKLALREGEFNLQNTFPKKPGSKKLSLWNLAFPWFNVQFALFMGAFYLLFSWIMQGATDSTFMMNVSQLEINLANIPEFLIEIGKIITHNPSVAFAIAAVIYGVYKFTDTKSTRLKYVGIIGLIHGLIHIINGYLLIWIFASLFSTEEIPGIIKFSAAIFVAGGITGCIVMGVYLLLTNLYLGIHDNEAFSSIKWSGYKNFIRMHIDHESLTIYPIGLHKTATWQKQGKIYVPDQKVKTQLIDRVIRIKTNRYDQTTQSVPVVAGN